MMILTSMSDSMWLCLLEGAELTRIVHVHRGISQQGSYSEQQPTSGNARAANHCSFFSAVQENSALRSTEPVVY
jgi:hypothetical protein